MAFYGRDGILETSMEFFMERILLPILFLLMAALVFGGIGYGIYWGIGKFREPPPETMTLTKKYWVCTSTYVSHHRARSGIKGMSGTPAYDSVECDQWSAKMVGGYLGGNATEAPNAKDIEKAN